MVSITTYVRYNGFINTLDAIKTRRAVREWSTKDVPEGLLSDVLQAGRWAPSPLNSHPWSFIVVRDKEKMLRLTPIAQHGSFLSTANVVIAVTVSKNAEVDEWLSEHQQHIYSGVCAIENMWLAAWDLGLGACWVTLDEKAARVLLAIPDDQILLGSLALGYPASEPKPHSEDDRRTLAEMVSYEKFGQK